MQNELYSEEQIIQAIQGANGLLSVAAKKLKCTRQTIYNYSNKYPSVREAITEARETMTDEAESQLFKKVKKGDPWAVCFYLKTQAKDRGYVERQEFSLSKMSEDELRDFITGKANSPSGT